MGHNARENYTNIKNELAKKEGGELFSRVLGYDDIKSELLLIRSWYLNESIQADEKIVLPKGIIFYGDPGCGKTLFTIELAKSFNWPIVIIEGYDSDKAIENIHQCFDEARKVKGGKAVIVIDEMDLLIDNCNSIAHALQTEIDGFNKADSQFFIIATTNKLYNIPSPLKRQGRFDRLVEVSLPNSKNRILLFKKFLAYYNLDATNIDFPELVRSITSVSGADIKAICNDASLRIGNNITTDELIFSYNRVINNKYLREEEPERKYHIAVHEAGHVIECLKNKDYTFFHHSNFTHNGATTRSCVENRDLSILKNVKSDIEINLGGIIAEKLILNRVEFGCDTDVNNVRDTIYRIIERGGYHGIKYFTEGHNRNREFYRLSETMVLKKEKLWYKTYKRFYKETYKYLKHHKGDIIKIANFMMEHGTITYKDIPNLNLLVSQENKTQIATPSIINKPSLALNSASENEEQDNNNLEDLLD